MTELPQPENYTSIVNYKQDVYDLIEKGVPSWIFDIKLSIKFKQAHNQELEDYEKKLVKSE